MILTVKILQQVMTYGIANYVLKQIYPFVLSKLILMKITQFILILTLIFRIYYVKLTILQTMIIQKMKIHPTANTKILAISLII